MPTTPVRPLHLFVVILGSIEIVLFAGVIFGWHSIVYIYKEEGYFYDCEQQNKTDLLSNDTQTPNATAATSLAESCEEKSKNTQSNQQSICPDQDDKFNLIFTLATAVNGILSVMNGYLYDRFGTRFCRIILIICYLGGLLFNIAASADRPGLLFPGFILTTYGGYLILITNLQLAGLIPHLRSMLMSLYSGSYDTSSSMFLLFKVLYENGLHVNYSFAIQGILFCLIIISSTFLIHRKYRLPWPIPSDYVLHINSCNRQNDDAMEEHKSWTMNVNGSMVNVGPREKLMADGFKEEIIIDGDVDKDMDETSEKLLSSEEKAPLNIDSLDSMKDFDADGSDPKKDFSSDSSHSKKEINSDRSDPKKVFSSESSDSMKDFKKIAVSPLFFFDLMWMCFQRLRSWFFVGMFNPWITRLACGDKALVSHYTSFFAIVQFIGIFTAPMSGRLMDRKIKSVHQYTNPKYERLHASIASFLLNITVAVVFSITTAIPIIEVQYVTCILHSLHRSFLYGPNSAFIANAFPAKHFGKLFGISLTVSAVFGMLQYPLFLLIQGPLDNDPLVVNILFIILMLLSYIHPAYIWHYLKKKHQH